MSDWDFLHDMHNEGYSTAEIADAASCGYNPWGWVRACDDELPELSTPADPELVKIFEGLVETAKSYHALTNRYLQIWGELGEIYAEIKFGLKRHKPHTQGSDGRLGNDFIEIKTISPEKNLEKIQVKRAGNFNKLLVVKISPTFAFEARFLERRSLNKGDGTHASVSWSTLMKPEYDLSQLPSRPNPYTKNLR